LRRGHSGASGCGEPAAFSRPELLSGCHHSATAAPYHFAGAAAKIRKLTDERRYFGLQFRVTLLCTAPSEF